MTLQLWSDFNLHRWQGILVLILVLKSDQFGIRMAEHIYYARGKQNHLKQKKTKTPSVVSSMGQTVFNGIPRLSRALSGVGDMYIKYTQRRLEESRQLTDLET